MPMGRGLHGMAQLLRRLPAKPLCRDGGYAKIVREANVHNHIVPLAHGGSDEGISIRCQCAEHHLVRTAEKFRLRQKMRIGPDGWPAE